MCLHHIPFPKEEEEEGKKKKKAFWAPLCPTWDNQVDFTNAIGVKTFYQALFQFDSIKMYFSLSK